MIDESKLRDGRVFTDPENHVSRGQAWANRVHYKRKEAEERQNPPKKLNTGLRSAVRYGFSTVEEVLKIPNLPDHLVRWLKKRLNLTKKESE